MPAARGGNVMLTGNTLLVGCPLGALATSGVLAVFFARFTSGCDSASDAELASSCFAVTFRLGGIGRVETRSARKRAELMLTRTRDIGGLAFFGSCGAYILWSKQTCKI